jgi:spore germination protein KA
MKYQRNKPKIISGKKPNQTENDSALPLLPSEKQLRSVFWSIDENFAFLNDLLGNAIGLVGQKYYLQDNKTEIGIVYINGITDKEYVSKSVIQPLLSTNPDAMEHSNHMLRLIQSKLTYIPGTRTCSEMKLVTENLFQGNTVLFINGIDEAIIIGSANFEKRSVEKPENEPSLFSSMDAFTEDLDINCSLLIRRLPTPDLRFEEFRVGRISNTKLLLLWIENIADIKAVEEVRQRIQSIDVDVVEGIGVLSEIIEDHPLTVFPKFKQTQRPDVTARYLTDGHFAILCSNSPWVFVAPVTFWDNFITADDYVNKSPIASYLRLLRFLAFNLSVYISPLYLAFVTHHQSVVPPALAINIASGREGVPFPSVVELLLLTVIIDIIREAALTIPASIGFFVGILGAVVIGQAAVTAGYVSASVIIVVAVSAIASFGITSNSLGISSRLINYILIIITGVFGMYGLINGVAILMWRLLCLESFGIPYLYPLIPFDSEAMKDSLIRAPFSHLTKRFGIFNSNNRRRIGEKGIK